MEESEWDQDDVPDLGTGSADSSSVSDTDSSDSDQSDVIEEEEEEASEETTSADQKQGSAWQLKQRENRMAAARRLPLLKTLFLRVKEGFHPGVQCSSRSCSEAKLLLRCLGCSPTLLFCSTCWVEQHTSVRTQHIPEVYIDGWRTVTHFLRSDGLLELDTYYPVCVASPAGDLEGVIRLPFVL